METEPIRRHFNNSNLLPEDIIEEILSKLPAKSLLKFRCVSKPWRSLIDSKRFIKAHLDNSKTSTSSVTRRNMILSIVEFSRSTRHFSLHSVFNEPVTNSFEFYHDPSNKFLEYHHIVGCCNGLICALTHQRQFTLWNPCTRMSKKLPYLGDDMNLVVKFGFGFDETNGGDYKVFASSRYVGLNGVHGEEKVYSSKTDSWKSINEYEDDSVFEYAGAGKFVRGKLHWVAKSLSEWGFVRKLFIRSFDLKNQLYGTVEQPMYRQGAFGQTLGVLEGCLCLICDYWKSHLDVWSLKEYGVKESWNIFLRVPYNLDPLYTGFSVALLCVGPNKEILLHNGSAFVIYYPKENRFRDPKIVNCRGFFEADVYVESLVSPFSDGDDQQDLIC